jgi:hypothetical protein
MWSEYHRGQARTLVNLARLTRDPNTAASLMRLAAQHAEMADQAESQRPDEAESERVKFVSPFARRMKRGVAGAGSRPSLKFQ